MLNFLDLWNCICRYKINNMARDSWSWSGKQGSKFTTKYMYEILSNERLGEDGDLFSWKKLWWKVVPSKVGVFTWKAIRERIPSKENLLKQGLSFCGDSGACSLCLSVVESLNHLLFTGPSVIMVWSTILQWLGKSVLYSLRAKDHYLEFLDLEQITIWKLWKAINELIFKESRYTLDELIDGIKFCVWKWIRAHYPVSFSVPFNI